MKNSFGELRRLFALTFSDSWRMLRQMWRVPIVVLATICLQVLAQFVLGRVITTPIGTSLLHTLLAVATSWVIAPYMVALLRFVLTGRSERAESIRNTSAVQRFFAWTATVTFVASGPGLLATLVRGSAATAATFTTTAGLASVWLEFGLSFVLGIYFTRLVTLLPATAMSNPKSLAQAYAETRGHFWFIVGATALPVVATLVVAFLASIVLSLLVRIVADRVDVALITRLVLMVALLFLTFVGASVAARLYERLSPQPDRIPSP